MLHIPFPLPPWDSLMARTRTLKRCSMPQALRNRLPFLMCFVFSRSYCCVLSSDFHKSSWTFHGICMKLLPNAASVFVGPVRGVESADVCHLKQSQVFPSQRGNKCKFSICLEQQNRPVHMFLLSLMWFPNWVYVVGHRGWVFPICEMIGQPLGLPVYTWS